MSKRLPLVLILTLALGAPGLGCLTSQDVIDDRVCPNSNRFELRGRTYCALSREIIEKGFSCPTDLIIQHDLPGANGGAVCSPSTSLPPEDLPELVDVFDLDGNFEPPWDSLPNLDMTILPDLPALMDVGVSDLGPSEDLPDLAPLEDMTPDLEPDMVPDLPDLQDMTVDMPPEEDMAPDMPITPGIGTHNPFHGVPSAQNAGEALFAESTNGCTACHGPDGRQDALGNPNGNLTNTSVLDNDLEIFDTIRLGRGVMPPYDEASLTDDDIWRITAWIRLLR